jgi:hypothetical protein
MTPGRLPLAPLERLLRARHDAPARRNGEGHDDGLWSIDVLARMLGTTARTVHRWKSEGLTPRQADRAAVAAGTHPLLVWGLQWLIAEIGTDLRKSAA